MTDKGTCVVTGAASGIGLATASELLGQGFRVALLDLELDKLEAAQAGLAGAKDQSRVFAADVTRETAINEAMLAIEREFGPVTGLVNCAGIARDVPFIETTPGMFRHILDVNVVGSFIAAQAAARAMIEGGRAGSIVNLASVSGMRGNIGRTAYGASKGAVITMTKVMAVELAAHNIRVNAVSPGPVDTPLVKALHSEDMRQLWLRSIPQRRYAAPSEIASAIAFLLDGAKSGFITGHILAVDGGFDAGGLLPPMGS